ncbi:MAG: hypothetical protein LKF58_03590 [Bacilli bacterium]|jgi:hypothetical protein|nr:hypothetical protein [Bacilli bacterium]MCI2055004.1 hypothetical protein [Bacilli bacterium]
MALNKKKTLLGLVSLVAGVSMLAGCSTVEAKPTASVYDEAILDFDNVTNNTMGDIYDALVTGGDTNSGKVLNNILYLYSTTVYGNFFDTTSNGSTVKGLKSVVDEYEADNSKTSEIQAFADSYSVYGGKIQKVVNFYDEVLYRIRTTFLGYVTNTSYQVRSKFQEKLFYDAQTEAYYDLANVTTVGGVDNYPYNQASKQVEGSFRLSEGYTEKGSLILDGQKEDAGDATNAYFKDIFGTYKNYIELAILPDIYRNELTSQYLYTQNFGQLKMTSERKIDCITLPKNAQYPDAVKNLVLQYNQKVIVAGKDMDDYGFSYLNTLYSGVLDGLDTDHLNLATEIYSAAGWTTSTLNGSGATFYNESAYGTICQSYNKLTDNRFTDDSSVRSDFTNSGAYSVDTGLAIKTQALVATDKTTHGWYSSSSAVSGLTDTIKKRLFKIQVANEVDSVDWDSASKSYQDAELSYGYYVGGNYYLVPQDRESTEKYPYIMEESGSYYIVKVDEAVKAVKITATDSTTGSGSSQYYDSMAKHSSSETYYGEQVARQVAYSLSTSDTWKKASNQYYVEQMALVYHDDYVYSYFKSTFPDLFD